MDPVFLIMLMLIGLVVGLLISAVFLRLAVRIVAGFEVPFGRAFFIMFMACLANLAIKAFFALLIGPVEPSRALQSLVAIPFTFLAGALINGWLVKNPENDRSIGFLKGLLVSLVLLLIGSVIVLLIVGSYFLFFAR